MTERYVTITTNNYGFPYTNHSPVSQATFKT